MLSCRSASGVALLVLCGCSSYGGPHHPYAPLLNAAGQIDVAVTAGASAPSAPTFAAHVAIAPVDHLVITGGFDTAPPDQAHQRVSGELAAGVFAARDPRIRAEVLAGVGAGWSLGEQVNEDETISLEGPYVRPFVQGFLGGVWGGFFTWGGGLRGGATVAFLDELSSEDPPGDVMQNRRIAFNVDPFTSFRFRFDVFEIDITGGGGLQSGQNLSLVNIHASLTLRLVFQAWGDAPPRGYAPVEPAPEPPRPAPEPAGGPGRDLDAPTSGDPI